MSWSAIRPVGLGDFVFHRNPSRCPNRTPSRPFINLCSFRAMPKRALSVDLLNDSKRSKTKNVEVITLDSDDEVATDSTASGSAPTDVCPEMSSPETPSPSTPLHAESDSEWGWNWNWNFASPKYDQYYGWNWHDDCYYDYNGYGSWSWNWSDYSQAGYDNANACQPGPEPFCEWWRQVSSSTSTGDAWWGSDRENTPGWVWNDLAGWTFIRSDGLIWEWICGNAEIGDTNPAILCHGYGSWILCAPLAGMFPDDEHAPELPEEFPALSSYETEVECEIEVEEVEPDVAPQTETGIEPDTIEDLPPSPSSCEGDDHMA